MDDSARGDCLMLYNLVEECDERTTQILSYEHRQLSV